MTRRSVLSVAGAGVTLLTLAWPPADNAGTPPAPLAIQKTKDRLAQTIGIAVIHPPVFWRERPEDNVGREIRPDPNRNGMATVPAGAWVRCGEGGKMRLILPPDTWTLDNTPIDETKENANEAKKRKEESAKWQRVPLLSSSRGELADKASLGATRRAGRTRDVAKVFSPQQGRVVWPDSLVFRWAPRPAGEKVSLELRSTATKAMLWKNKEPIDGATGEYTNPEAGEALRRWRDQRGGGASGRLTLAFQAGDDRASVTFDVLTKEKEEALTRELALWDDQTDGLLRHLGRAEVFYQFDLLPESAAEYELALKLDPEDPLVRRRTVEANWMIGNVARAEQLGSRKDAP